MAYFNGKFDYSIDEHNRLSIPARIRKAMSELEETSFVVSKEQKSYLILYPEKIWNARVLSKVSEQSQSNDEAIILRRLIGQNTTTVKLDKQGRINIPPDYYNHAGIEKKIKIVGAVEIVELWNPVAYEPIAKELEKLQLIDKFKKFGI